MSWAISLLKQLLALLPPGLLVWFAFHVLARPRLHLRVVRLSAHRLPGHTYFINVFLGEQEPLVGPVTLVVEGVNAQKSIRRESIRAYAAHFRDGPPRRSVVELGVRLKGFSVELNGMRPRELLRVCFDTDGTEGYCHVELRSDRSHPEATWNGDEVTYTLTRQEGVVRAAAVLLGLATYAVPIGLGLSLPGTDVLVADSFDPVLDGAVIAVFLGVLAILGFVMRRSGWLMVGGRGTNVGSSPDGP